MSVEIIAHRGASYDAPENTLAAINLGWTQHADAVEIDVQLSRDHQLVVIHDDNTRKTGGLSRKIAGQTVAELKTLDVGRWKHERWAGERIPLLSEALSIVPAGKRLFIEIKCGPACLPRLVADVHESGRDPSQVVPIGFSLDTMKLVKAALPELEVCWVAEFKRSLHGWTPTAEALIQQARSADLDGIDVGTHGPVDAGFVDQVHRAGLKIYLWTVDLPERARELVNAGVDGITTNRPQWLREQGIR